MLCRHEIFFKSIHFIQIIISKNLYYLSFKGIFQRHTNKHIIQLRHVFEFTRKYVFRN